MIPLQVSTLFDSAIKLFANNIGRYSGRRSDRQFFEDNLKIKVDEFVGHIIFDYFDQYIPGGLDIMSDRFPDFSGDDFELAHDYIEFHPETKRVVAQLKEMIDFAIKMSQFKKNPSAAPQGSMAKKTLDLIEAGPNHFVQAFELMGSLL